MASDLAGVDVNSIIGNMSFASLNTKSVSYRDSSKSTSMIRDRIDLIDFL